MNTLNAQSASRSSPAPPPPSSSRLGLSYSFVESTAVVHAQERSDGTPAPIAWALPTAARRLLLSGRCVAWALCYISGLDQG